MSRILLLIVLLTWLALDASTPQFAAIRGAPATGLFLGGFALVLLFLGLWSRVLARHVGTGNLQQSLARFNLAMFWARAMVPAWFAVGVLLLDWHNTVITMLGRVRTWPVELPGAILGTLPAFAAWMGLWWAQFPADRALREQSLLLQLEDGLPVHAPPGFWSYFIANLRLQLLFTAIPVALILFLRDVAAIILWLGAGMDLRSARTGLAPATAAAQVIEWLLVPLSAIIVFILAPEILRHVLLTQRLPDSPLRAKLETLCRSMKLRYRDILLWRTGNNMGNAAVMGIVPRMRYILLSDLLMETMTDEQIEAVFAHEAGHIVHRHMTWYVVFIMILMLWALGPAQWLDNQLAGLLPARFNGTVRDLIWLVVLGAIMLKLFGLLSRFFERQADVYAARTMQTQADASGGQVTALSGSCVGRHGAAMFSSALERVAVINNIPIRARNFSHGSIADRLNFLRILSRDPDRTGQFDRGMRIVFATMLLALTVGAVWAGIVIWSQGLGGS
ncbi:MAG: M48 family metallopeptidase [Tepidisphaeraceae bacterium]